MAHIFRPAAKAMQFTIAEAKAAIERSNQFVAPKLKEMSATSAMTPITANMTPINQQIRHVYPCAPRPVVTCSRSF